MMIKMPRDQRNIDVAAFTNRLAVVQCFENREPARMLLHLPGQCIEIACTRVRTEGLPCRQSTPRSFHRAIDIRCRSFCHYRESFTCGRVRGVEISPCRGRLPGAVHEMSKAPAVTVQPGKRLARILGRGAVLHGYEFLDNAHRLVPGSFLTAPRSCRSCNRMAIVR